MPPEINSFYLTATPFQDITISRNYYNILFIMQNVLYFYSNYLYFQSIYREKKL